LPRAVISKLFLLSHYGESGAGANYINKYLIIIDVPEKKEKNRNSETKLVSSSLKIKFKNKSPPHPERKMANIGLPKASLHCTIT
jgi:hypothetical protein